MGLYQTRAIWVSILTKIPHFFSTKPNRSLKHHVENSGETLKTLLASTKTLAVRLDQWKTFGKLNAIKRLENGFVTPEKCEDKKKPSPLSKKENIQLKLSTALHCKEKKAKT